MYVSSGEPFIPVYITPEITGEQDEPIISEPILSGTTPSDVMETDNEEDESLQQAVALSMQDAHRQQQLETLRQIKQQQDNEYYESLLMDREREKKLEQEEELKKEQMWDDELEAAKALSIQLSTQSQLERKCKALPAEPDEKLTDPQLLTQLVLRLPTGERVQRNFLRTDTLQVVRDFVDVKRLEWQIKREENKENADSLKWPEKDQLITDFPRTRLDTSEKLGMTLEELKLFPRAMVSVAELLQ